jgi:hypothetical protein
MYVGFLLFFAHYLETLFNLAAYLCLSPNMRNITFGNICFRVIAIRNICFQDSSHWSKSNLNRNTLLYWPQLQLSDNVYFEINVFMRIVIVSDNQRAVNFSHVTKYIQ